MAKKMRYLVLSISILAAIALFVAFYCKHPSKESIPTSVSSVNDSAGNNMALPLSMTNYLGMRFKLLPAGEFTMGSPANEIGRNLNEGPQHKVILSRSFYIGIYEVTQDEYEKVMGENPSEFKGSPQFPVEGVSWHDAVEFCAKMSGADENYLYRLPTEAEWEYSCRAGTSSSVYWGDDWNDDYCWDKETSEGKIREVGKKKPNAWGLYDMCGNVWEWCNDWFVDSYSTEDQHDPKGVTVGTERVIRGGSRCGGANYSRSSSRSHLSPDGSGNYLGLRVVAIPKK